MSPNNQSTHALLETVLPRGTYEGVIVPLGQLIAESAGVEGLDDTVAQNSATEHSLEARLIDVIDQIPPYLTNEGLDSIKSRLDRSNYVVRRNRYCDSSGYAVELGFQLQQPGDAEADVQRGSELLRTKDGRKHDRIILNALFHQKRAAALFGLPQSLVRRSARKSYFETGNSLTVAWSDSVYMQALDRHIDFLEEQGASEADVATEVSGHLLHEAVHEIEDNQHALATLLDGRPPIGEITPITAQLAYYAATGYFGPSSYNDYSREKGQNLVGEGVAPGLKQDIGTYVGYELLIEHLQNAFPELLVSSDDPVEMIEELRSQITSKHYIRMLDALKAAICDSANPEEVDRVIGIAKVAAA